MFGWLKNFFMDGQTFTSTIADVGTAGAGIVVAAAPELIESLLGNFAPVVTLAAGYVLGGVSGTTTRAAAK